MPSDVRWAVFGEAVIGTVVAPNNRAAMATAKRLGYPVSRVRAEASVLVDRDPPVLVPLAPRRPQPAARRAA